jgi:DNA polymerase
MESVVLAGEVDFAGWRAAARRLALAGIAPEQAIWSVGEASDLFATEGETPAPTAAFSVPRGLVELAETAIQAREPARFALLYGLIWRAHRGEKRILEDVADPLVQRVQRLAQAVRRDTHKMRAFLRFRGVREDDAMRYVAWFEPSHLHRRGEYRLLHPPLRDHDLVDPDALSQRALGWRDADLG